MKLFQWNRDAGVWATIQSKYLRIDGTTPRNADVFQFNLEIGPLNHDFSIWVTLGRLEDHPGIIFWWGIKSKQFRLKRKDCKCYDCRLHKPIPREVIEAMMKSMTDPDRPVKVLKYDED